jgi:ABC-type Zn uptake system ZnuABC Zn-binding protein ZnuA
MILTLCVLLAGCASSAAGDKPVVVATTTQAGDLVRNIADGDADVRVILRPGADPHEYEPRPSDARDVASAKVVVRSGGEVDSWLGDVLDQAGRSAERVDLSASVELSGDDPHWWQDPRNAERAVEAIRAALTKADPGRSGDYAKAATAYTQRLDALDAEIERCVARIPRDRRKLVTTHDALAYYARRYGFQVIGALIPSLSTQAQPSAGEIEALVRQIRREKVRAIFPESGINPKLERAVARETGARTGGRLWADTLGGAGTPEGTYIGALRANTRTIVTGLTGRGC